MMKKSELNKKQDESNLILFCFREENTKDDFKVTVTPTNIIQSSEYYPFGLKAASSWTRENNSNNFLYDAGSELNNTTGMYDLPFRNYDASLGRFFQVDALSTTSHSVTPYHYAGNNPIAGNDPSGLVVQYYANPEDNPMNHWMTISSGVYHGDDWSFAMNFTGGGSIATFSDQSLTDRIKGGIDSNVSGSISIPKF